MILIDTFVHTSMYSLIIKFFLENNWRNKEVAKWQKLLYTAIIGNNIKNNVENITLLEKFKQIIPKINVCFNV